MLVHSQLNNNSLSLQIKISWLNILIYWSQLLCRPTSLSSSLFICPITIFLCVTSFRADARKLSVQCTHAHKLSHKQKAWRDPTALKYCASHIRQQQLHVSHHLHAAGREFALTRRTRLPKTHTCAGKTARVCLYGLAE